VDGRVEPGHDDDRKQQAFVAGIGAGIVATWNTLYRHGRA
jgi:hypothetical protein